MRIWRLDLEEKHVLPIYAWTTYLCAAASKVMDFGAFVGWEWAWILTMLVWNSVFFTLVFCLQGTNFCLAKFLRGSHFWLTVVIHSSRVEILEVWNGVSVFVSGRERIVTDFDLKLGKGFKVKNPHSHQKRWDYLPQGLSTCPRQKPSFAVNPIIVLFLIHWPRSWNFVVFFRNGTTRFFDGTHRIMGEYQ